MKYILVTGAFGGMGRAFIEKAKERGYSVFALDITIPEDFNEENIIPISCDITKENSLLAARTIVRTYTDSIYAVVHFAGLYTLNSLLEITHNDWEKIFSVNVTGPYLVNKTFISLLKKGSRILITTSELAPLKPLPFTGLYAVTKAALERYAFSLLMELQLKDIFVSVLRPGAVRTGMIDKSTSDLDKFCKETKLYNTNAKRFKKIVDSVEAKSIAPSLLADKAMKIIESRRPRFSYTINNNFLLKLTRFCPKRLEAAIVKKILQ